MNRRTGFCVGVLVASSIIGSLFLIGCGRQAGPPKGTPVERVGPWQVAVANSPDPPHVGDNVLVIGVRDSADRPMQGSVEAVVSMQAMGAMPYMESRGKVKPAGAGIYRASYGLPMGGEWDVAIALRPTNGTPAEARYRLSTSIRGLAFAGGTPSAGMSSAAPGAMPPVAVDYTSGAVMIEAARRQSLGIRTEPVRVRALSSSLRVPGRVAYDEAHQAEVSLKFGGWVRELAASVTGQPVKRGQILFKVYSPELWSAQQEYLEALRAARTDANNASLAGSSSDLAHAARERLALWDLSPADIDAIARSARPMQAIPIRSPVSGVVTEKNMVLGSAFQPGQVLFKIARLDPIWVIASVPQQDAGLVRAGMDAMIRDPYSEAGARHGRVAFVYPSLDSMTRTVEARITTTNPGGHLQPGTFLEVQLVTPVLDRLAVPESAVLPTGERYVVFVDLGDGRLAPREVRLGMRAAGYYEVRNGLRAGDVVVTSGNFLVGAESKLRSASQKW